MSLILVTFAAAVGLGVSSTAPTWRDASAALWVLSGICILQALVSFGFGAYIAGRIRTAPTMLARLGVELIIIIRPRCSKRVTASGC